MADDLEDEKNMLGKGFELNAALAGWLAIQLIERNISYFTESEKLMKSSRDAIESGMTLAESGNHRVAYNYFMDAVNSMLDQEPTLLGDKDLKDALNRIHKMNRETITPLFEKLDNLGLLDP